MTKRLPGLGGESYVPIEGEDFQRIANATAWAVEELLANIHAMENAKVAGQGASHGDGGPMIAGAIGGTLHFTLRGEISDELLRARIMEAVDALLPQIRMEKAAAGRAGGRA